MRLSIRQKGLVLVSVPIIFELAFIAILASFLAQGQTAVEQESRARSLISHVIEVTMSCQDAYIALGKFGFCHDMSAYSTAQRNLLRVKDEISLLKDLTSSRPNEFHMVKEFDEAIKSWIDTGEVVQDAYVKQDLFSYMRVLPAFFAASDGVHHKARALVAYLSTVENNQLREHGALTEQIRNLMFWGVIVTVMVTTLLSYMFFNDLTKRLLLLKENSKALRDGTTLLPAQRGDDEIAHVDKAFRQMASVLQETRKKELAIVEYSADVICSIDLKGRFSQVSPAAVPLWGYAPEELLGENWSKVLHPDDVAATQDAVASMIKDRDKSLVLENTVIKKNNEMRDALWSVTWSDEQKSLFCVAHDITERKTAQNKLEVSDMRARSVVESMPIGVITATITGIIESVNGKAEELFQSNAGHLQSQNLFRLFTPSSVSQLQQLLTSQNGEHSPLELKAVRLNRTEFPCEVRTSRYNTLEGQKYQINITDLTHRHEIERLKEELVSMVSHDLRSPLTSLQGTLTLLEDGIYGKVSPDGETEINNASAEIDRLIAMVSDLLDLEKIETGKMSMQFEHMSVEKLIATSLERVAETADKKGISFDVEMQKETLANGANDQFVEVDTDKVIQVITQLLSAAIHFSQGKQDGYMSQTCDTVKILIEANKKTVRISITDNGPSIPDEMRRAVFDRFRRMEAVDNERARYSGLSLALAKSIIALNRGEIGIADTPDGASFWISLPLAN